MALTINPISTGNSNDAMMFKSGTNATDVRNATASNGIGGHNSGSASGTIGHFALFGTTYNYRYICAWDLSGYSGTVTGADFKLYSNAEIPSGFATFKNADIYLCKTDLASETFDNNTYNDLDNWPSSGSYAGTVDNYGNGTKSSTSAGYHTLALNSDGLTDINSAVGSGLFSMIIISDDDYVSDISGTGLGGNAGYGGFLSIYGYNITTSNGVNKPELVLDGDGDFGTAAPPSVNAIFFGTNF